MRLIMILSNAEVGLRDQMANSNSYFVYLNVTSTVEFFPILQYNFMDRQRIAFVAQLAFIMYFCQSSTAVTANEQKFHGNYWLQPEELSKTDNSNKMVD